MWMRAKTGNGVSHTKLHADSTTMPEFGPDVKNVTFSVQQITSNIVRVKIGGAGRWEVPRNLFKAEKSVTGAQHL
jgi:hypothetical protein